MRDYRRLEVWKRARALAIAVYEVTDDFPRTEEFGLISQARRSAVSIVSNIAEGASRSSDRDFRRFLRYARASAAELEAQLDLAHEVGYVSPQTSAETGEILNHVKAMLLNLERRL